MPLLEALTRSSDQSGFTVGRKRHAVPEVAAGCRLGAHQFGALPAAFSRAREHPRRTRFVYAFLSLHRRSDQQLLAVGGDRDAATEGAFVAFFGRFVGFVAVTRFRVPGST